MIKSFDFDFVMQKLKKQVEYDYLCHPSREMDVEELDEMLTVLCDTLCSTKEYLSIGGENIPILAVKERLQKLDSSHIEYVAECMAKTTTAISNIRAYLLAALYNSPSTIGHFVSAQVRNNTIKGSSHSTHMD